MKLKILLVLLGAFSLAGCEWANLPLHNDYSEVKCEGFFSKTCEVQLTGEIKSLGAYNVTVKKISQLPKDAKVTVYLAGYGGSVDSLQSLYRALTSNGRTYDAVLIGNVYSAHAMLAAGAKKLTTTSDEHTVMFHRSSTYRMLAFNKFDYTKVCEVATAVKGTLLGKPVDQCVEELKQAVEDTKKFFDIHVFYILDKKDMKYLNEGGDVYMSARQLITLKEVKDA